MVKRFVILTDAGGDLPLEFREKYDIEVPPISTIVWPDKKERDTDIDWKSIKPNDFYKLMTDKKAVFQSSIPAPQTIYDRLKEYTDVGLYVLVITISSTMSGGYSAFTVAANQIMKEDKKAHIKVIDSLRYGPAIALLSIEASRCRESGMNFMQTCAHIEEMRLHVHQCGILDDLFFLARKGRISKTTAFMGNMVGIKPMADLCNETGLSEVIGKARGYKRFYKVLPSFITRTIGDYKDKTFLISNSLREEQAQEIEKIIKDKFNPEHLINIPLGQCTGVNVGPGLCAVYYIGDDRVSPHCEKEKAVLTELLKK